MGLGQQSEDVIFIFTVLSPWSLSKPTSTVATRTQPNLKTALSMWWCCISLCPGPSVWHVLVKARKGKTVKAVKE